MKLSVATLHLLSCLITTVHARIGGNIHSDDLHESRETAYAQTAYDEIDRLPHWPLKENLTIKIVGGDPVDPPDRYPYQVALTTSSGRQYCGGSLIAPGWVLSAAHCANYGSHVQIGRFDLNDITEDYENIMVDYELVHPDYDNSLLDNDFMLLKLKTDSHKPPVSIDNGSQNTDAGADVTVMGWGTTTYGGYSSHKLLEVDVDVVSNDECNSAYSGRVTDNMICAARPGKDACQGDSGGPLIIQNDGNMQNVLVGVVSWGWGCAHSNYPGVYSRVSKAYDWINEYISFDPIFPIFPGDFKWSSAGIPSGYDCTQIYERSDPHSWHDNYFCWKNDKIDPGMKWSSAGPISGMRCTQVHESSDPHTWHDNYLCVPDSSPLHFSWSSAGPIDGVSCIQWHESSDPHTWHDNYLCIA